MSLSPSLPNPIVFNEDGLTETVKMTLLHVSLRLGVLPSREWLTEYGGRFRTSPRHGFSGLRDPAFVNWSNQSAWGANASRRSFFPREREREEGKSCLVAGSGVP